MKLILTSRPSPPMNEIMTIMIGLILALVSDLSKKKIGNCLFEVGMNKMLI